MQLDEGAPVNLFNYQLIHFKTSGEIMKKYFAVVFIYLLMTGSSYSQTIPFDSLKWDLEAVESRIEQYLGQESLYLRGGLVYPKDSDFLNGIIEFDIVFGPERGFMGAVWRMQDVNNFEQFYMRPHQSGNPDANQYTPVFNGIAGWQLYYGEGYGAPVKYSFDKWMHVKIVVSGKNVEVYIVDMEQPALFVSDQKREIKSGKVGLWVSNFAPCHFANFSYTKLDNPRLKGKEKSAENVPKGTVMSWRISNTIDEKSLDQKFQLTPADKQGLSWSKLDCEASGLANLARVQGIEKNKNCAIARITIISDKDQTKKVEFGYSDRIKVYLNDRLLYGGNNDYMSRDYRYLGTIGYFDELYLPLRKGENELWMAVSETFGGWGILARFDSMDGISISDK
jgi:hypothetical protein